MLVADYSVRNCAFQLVERGYRNKVLTRCCLSSIFKPVVFTYRVVDMHVVCVGVDSCVPIHVAILELWIAMYQLVDALTPKLFEPCGVEVLAVGGE